MNIFNVSDFGSEVIDQAYEQIISESLNFVYCSLTGARVGLIDDHEIKLCLQMELSRKPLASADELADAFALRSHVYSSGPAPSLRVHKDNKTMIYMLRKDPAGHNRLFTYLSGRLFYDALIPLREHGSSLYSAARLSFLREMMIHLYALGTGWEDSLTSEDEDPEKDSSVIDHPKEAERKAAAHSLDLMLRLDSIHNIRNLLLDPAIRDRLTSMRDVGDADWSFQRLHEVLQATESDGLLRLARASQRDVSGNSMVITTLLERLRWSSKRVSKYMDVFEEIPEHKFRSSTTGGQLLAHVGELLQQSTLSKRDREHLKSVANQINQTGEVPSWSDKRLDVLNRKVARSAESSGNVIIKRGDAATKSMAESYLRKGIALRPELKAEMERIIAEGTVKVNKTVRNAIEHGTSLKDAPPIPHGKAGRKMAVAKAKNFALFERTRKKLFSEDESLPMDFTSLVKKED